jgi:hypothetical protein
MDKAFVAQRVANKLFATEDKVDAALAEATELMSELLKARKELNLSAVFGDEAVTKLADAIKTISDARATVVGVHNELNEAKLRLGLRTKMYGEKPPQQSAAHQPAIMREAI